MANSKKNAGKQVISYRYGDKRKNNPHVGMVDTVSDGVEGHTTWAYDPHIDPTLNFDTARAGIENLIDDALASGDERWNSSNACTRRISTGPAKPSAPASRSIRFRCTSTSGLTRQRFWLRYRSV